MIIVDVEAIFYCGVTVSRGLSAVVVYQSPWCENNLLVFKLSEVLSSLIAVNAKGLQLPG
jgi:hypothetical protein